ncbi:GreA/GreB family elongation factor [Bermanella marisrubri]|uniref:Transcription elongation factor GreA/GreB C-terminal domain-containing protein n=1 Tax=Bermanella marisrubri TaxID=207949 RepID=Q1MZY3_9GAMM|nr:hypothetical protein [Bermanella marisrubri]EAT11580.1 hypothetical protein RED65_02879 [Oceanobacter sp. RED65] [Bermanella marisrubri]QIZ84958.1 GreA/GreB family elongation factor [Bermanella marisrubri]
MDKHTLLDQLVQQLLADIDEHIKAAEQAHNAATHEQSKAETQYDTLGLEQAYLAHGQSERIDNLQQQIARLNHFDLRTFDEDDEIHLGAFVQLINSQTNKNLDVFILPCAGGYTLEKSIHTLTPDTPIAKAIMGLGIDDEFKLGNGQRYRITKVS